MSRYASSTFVFLLCDLLRRIERIGSLVSSIHAGAWSLAFPQPRTCLSTPALVKRLAAHGFTRRTDVANPEMPLCVMQFNRFSSKRDTAPAQASVCGFRAEPTYLKGRHWGPRSSPNEGHGHAAH